MSRALKRVSYEFHHNHVHAVCSVLFPRVTHVCSESRRKKERISRENEFGLLRGGIVIIGEIEMERGETDAERGGRDEEG